MGHPRTLAAAAAAVTCAILATPAARAQVAGIHGYRSGGQAVLRVKVLWFGWPPGGSGGGSWLPAGGREVTFFEKRHGAWSPVSGIVRTNASGTARLRVPESWAHYFRVQVAETQRLWGDTSSPARV